MTEFETLMIKIIFYVVVVIVATTTIGIIYYNKYVKNLYKS